MLELLKKSLENAPVIKRGTYNYFIHPITDGIPQIDAELLKEICDAIIEKCNLDVDRIVTIESMGIHIATALSLSTGIPFNIVRKKQYWLPSELALHQTTGYSTGELYMNSINRSDKIIVVDSVISTGGTMTAVLKGLKKIGADVKDVIAVIERGDGVNRVKEETGFDVKTLIKIKVTDTVEILDVS